MVLHIKCCKTHVTGCTELPLTVFDLWAEFLEQGFLHPPDGWGLPACLQGHLGIPTITAYTIIVKESIRHICLLGAVGGTHLKRPDVLSTNHKLVPFAEDSLTSALTVLLFALPSYGGVSLLLCQVEGGKTLRCWGLFWGWR